MWSSSEVQAVSDFVHCATLGPPAVCLWFILWSPWYVLCEKKSCFVFKYDCNLIVTLTIHAKLYAWFWSIAVEMCVHLAIRSLVWSDTDVKWEGLGCCWSSSPTQKCSASIRSGLFAEISVPSIHTMLLCTSLWTGALSCRNRSGFNPTDVLCNHVLLILWPQVSESSYMALKNIS